MAEKTAKVCWGPRCYQMIQADDKDTIRTIQPRANLDNGIYLEMPMMYFCSWRCSRLYSTAQEREESKKVE